MNIQKLLRVDEFQHQYRFPRLIHSNKGEYRNSHIPKWKYMIKNLNWRVVFKIEYKSLLSEIYLWKSTVCIH